LSDEKLVSKEVKKAVDTGRDALEDLEFFGTRGAGEIGEKNDFEEKRSSSAPS
jgi:hypothetical protein